MPASAMRCARLSRWTASSVPSRSSRIFWLAWTSRGGRVAVATQLVDLVHDRLQRRPVRIRFMLPPRGELALRQQSLERDAPARDAALDRADRTAANLGRLLIGETARTNEDQSLALRLRKVHQRPLHVAELDMAVLARRSGQQFGGGKLVPFSLEARPAHLAEEQVAQDDEGPGAHVGARLEPLAGRPCLEQRLLDKVVGQVAASRERSAEGAKMGNDLCQLFLELVVRQRGPLGLLRFQLAQCWLVARHYAAPERCLVVVCRAGRGTVTLPRAR